MPVLNETASLLAQCMRQTEDVLTRNMMLSTASQINCVNGVNGDNPTELTRADIDVVIRTLINNNAMRITDNIEGSLKFGTAPIRDSFWVMMNSNLIDDLESVDGFINVAQYPSSMNVIDSEWGSVGNSRWLQSSLGSTSATASLLAATVYNNFMVGKEAYAVVDLDEAAAEFIYKPLGWGNDALNQRQSAGFKMAMVPRILNDLWIYNLRATHS